MIAHKQQPAASPQAHPILAPAAVRAPNQYQHQMQQHPLESQHQAYAAPAYPADDPFGAAPAGHAYAPRAPDGHLYEQPTRHQYLVKQPAQVPQPAGAHYPQQQTHYAGQQVVAPSQYAGPARPAYGPADPPQLARAPPGRALQRPPPGYQSAPALQTHLQAPVRHSAARPAPQADQYGAKLNGARYAAQPAYEPAELSYSAGPPSYAAASPTLLQQQLNRHQPAARPAGYVPVRAANRQLAARYEPDQMEPMQAAYYQKQRPLANQTRALDQHHHQVHLHQPMPGNPTPPLTPTASVVPGRGAAPPALEQHQWPDAHAHQQHHQQMAATTATATTTTTPGPGRTHLPKSGLAPGQQFLAGQPAPAYQQHPHPPPIAPTSYMGPGQSQQTLPVNSHLHQHQTPPGYQPSSHQIRLTLPRREPPLLGPFKLDHDVQFTSKVFHIKSHLFDMLSKSLANHSSNPHATTVTHELHFRAFLVGQRPGMNQNQANGGDSLLAAHQVASQSGHCNWPELFQLSVNQQPIQLDRSKAAQTPLDIFQFCSLGDNTLDIQVNDCYCTHEFVLEAVDRPSIKAFMNSCFKSRLLDADNCIQKLKFHFGLPGFLVQSTASGIMNEYLSEYMQGVEQTRAKITLKCPISGRRMRTPARGHDCKHLQCFDLEKFLILNKDKSLWKCPICTLVIPFNMLELDQHQMNIVQSMMEVHNTDEILIDETGSWLAYHAPVQVDQRPQQQLVQAPISSHLDPPPPPPPPHNTMSGHQLGNHSNPQSHQVQQSTPPPPPSMHQTQVTNTAKSTGIYHPQPLGPVTVPNSDGPSPVRQQGLNWAPSNGQNTIQSNHEQMRRQGSGIGTTSQPVKRSTCSSPLAKKPYAGQFASTTSSGFSSNATLLETDDLSPLAAMERTIIQHEQQMGPPPFDPTSLTASPVRNSAANQSSQSLISSNQSPMAGGLPPQQVSPQHQDPMRPTSAAASFSPISHPPGTPVAVPSPGHRLMVAASPQQPAQSPMQQHQQLQQHQQHLQQQQQHHHHQQTLNNQSTHLHAANLQLATTPVTPSSSLLVHGGPETPATPSNTLQHCGPSSASGLLNHSPIVNQNSGQQQTSNSIAAVSAVDHQPLSNGSASAGSITSSSTMTPSAQSLGSVGMGGDSRCGTAPLPGTGSLALDDLMLPACGNHLQPSSGSNSVHQYKMSSGSNPNHMSGQMHNLMENDKSEILMNKLMMNSGESLLRHQHGHNSELALALEDAEWSQQLDQGKSEHLANFLNAEPMVVNRNQQRQQQHFQGQLTEEGVGHSLNQYGGGDGTNKKHPLTSDSSVNTHSQAPVNTDDLNNIGAHNPSSPGQSNLDEFVNYLATGEADDGVGLPGGDDILDLFER